MTPFPTLSRKPALKARETTVDPTLRDSMENGMESTRARYTRQRRQWDVSIDMLTPADKAKLNTFVVDVAVYGANFFGLTDYEDPRHPVYRVRFSTLPSYVSAGNVEGEFRKNCTFTVKEV